MLKNILNLNGVQQLEKKAQKSIMGGGTNFPSTQEDCELCGGNWYPTPLCGGMCELSVNSPCAN
ncbi:hypothetical protein [uncultured Dokdonia sp.]|uniref:hypothetical protein n=1 Tax=uncultured Dokdonia sp. TaxID=575653 RepID=UPI00261661D0|nr:hypothetical protein [uncultured Dokdonia sp.]